MVVWVRNCQMCVDVMTVFVCVRRPEVTLNVFGLNFFWFGSCFY